MPRYYLDGSIVQEEQQADSVFVNEHHPYFHPVTVGVGNNDGRGNHDCTIIGNELVSFNHPQDGGGIHYINLADMSHAKKITHNFAEAGEKYLEMKSVDYKDCMLLVGNGRALKYGETSYTEQGAKLYVFHEVDKWRNATERITFDNCGEYDVIDVSALGYKVYGFWGAADQVYVSCNLFNDIFLIQLEKADGRYTGAYSVINHWTQNSGLGELSGHGGQFYKGHLYIAPNDVDGATVFKCILSSNGELRFDKLRYEYKGANGLMYKYIDGLCVHDGTIYMQPLITEGVYGTHDFLVGDIV